MSRVRDNDLPDWVKASPWFNRKSAGLGTSTRDALVSTGAKIEAFAASIHPDDRHVAQIVSRLDLPMDDLISLVRALRTPGSDKPPNRPRGTAGLREKRIAFMAERNVQTHADILREASASPGSATEQSKIRALERLLRESTRRD